MQSGLLQAAAVENRLDVQNAAVRRHLFQVVVRVRAMRDVRDESVLVLGSTGPLSDMLKGLAAELGLEKRVLFPGRIPEEMLPAY